MHWADAEGLQKIVDGLKNQEARMGSRFQLLAIVARQGAKKGRSLPADVSAKQGTAMSDYMVEETTGDGDGALFARRGDLSLADRRPRRDAGLCRLHLPSTCPSGPERMEMFTVHKTVGATILLVALLRLAYRLINPPPPYPSDMPRWERFLAVWSHRIVLLPADRAAADRADRGVGRAKDGWVDAASGACAAGAADRRRRNVRRGPRNPRLHHARAARRSTSRRRSTTSSAQARPMPPGRMPPFQPVED